MNNIENKPEQNAQTQENQSKTENTSDIQQTAPSINQTDTSAVTQDEKLFGAIAYLNLGCLLTLAMKQKSQFCQFHAKQGVLLFIAFFLTIFILAIIPLIGWLIFFVIIGLSLYGAFNAYQGKTWKLPYISQYTEKIDLSKLDSIPFPKLPPQQNSETKKEEKNDSVKSDQDKAESNEVEKKEEK